MATKYRSLLFKCDLLATNNTALKSYTIDIEFLDLEHKKWEKLVTNIETKKGLLTHAYEIPLRISKTEIITRIIRDCMNKGSLPMFRIVKSNEKESLILSEAPTIFFDEEKLEITIDFQKLWLLDNAFILKKETAIIIASPFNLYPVQNEFSELKETNSSLSNLVSELKTDAEKSSKKYDTQLNEMLAHLNEHEETEATLKENLAAKNNELESLRAQLKTSSNNSNSDEINALETTLNEKANEAEALQQQLGELTASAEQNNELLNRIKELEDSATQLKEETISYENSAIEADKLNEAVVEKTKEIELLQQSKETIEAENKVLISEIEKTKTDLQTQQSAIDDLVGKIQESQQTVSEKDQEIASLTKNTTAKETEITKLQTQLAEMQSYAATENPNKLDAKKVYSSIVNDIADADAAMDNSRFKMANISLNLKTTVEKGPEGTLFGLIDFESAKNMNAAAISDIHIDVVPNTNSVKSVNTIPNVLGLTETAARKTITSYGLKLDVIYQPTDNPKFIEGQAIKQIPAVGTTLIQGQEVIVIFAKPLKN